MMKAQKRVPRASNYNVSKAHEFESFRQIPKYTHASMAVIHPVPQTVTKEVWKPDRKLNFDGTPVVPAPRRYEPKNIPEHLTRPQVDEETLIKIKTNEANKKVLEAKGMSLTQKKEFKLQQKRINDIKLKIRKAERSLKSFFSCTKKILEKNEEELVHQHCPDALVC